MKRILAISLALVLVLSGCKVTELATESPNTTTTAAGQSSATTTTGGSPNTTTTVVTSTSTTTNGNQETTTKHTTGITTGTTTGKTTGTTTKITNVTTTTKTMQPPVIPQTEHYENGVLVDAGKIDFSKDNHMIYYTESTKRVVDYADGYQIELPHNWEPDYSLSALRARYTSTNNDVVLTISKEETVNEPNTKAYIDRYMNRNIIDPQFRRNNNITLLSNATTQHGIYKCEVIKTKIEGMARDRLAYYTHVAFYNNSTTIYRLMFKSTTELDVRSILNSFQTFTPQGTGVNNFQYDLQIPQTWSKETKDYYNYLQNSDEVDWGMFCAQVETTGLSTTIPAFEARMNYDMPLVSQYVHYSWYGNKIPFPLDFANRVDAQGRVLQMTYQFTDDNNMSLNSYLPSLDIYRGTKESRDTLHAFAKKVKEYGKPLLFRLNNEMNTDWTSYCGLANMGDPDIFIQNWIALYTAFQEEGVNNAIWIFNAFNESYPPNGWSNYLNYLPPSQYVQMIGLTGYNSGSANSTWNTFPKLYDRIEEDYNRYFSEWPWIISEFGCGFDYEKVLNANSGSQQQAALREGQQKQAQWVTEMFDCFENNRYPNIKAALWFSANDYNGNVISRPYALDINNPYTMDAFKFGLARTHK